MANKKETVVTDNIDCLEAMFKMIDEVEEYNKNLSEQTSETLLSPLTEEECLDQMCVPVDQSDFLSQKHEIDNQIECFDQMRVTDHQSKYLDQVRLTYDQRLCSNNVRESEDQSVCLDIVSGNQENELNGSNFAGRQFREIDLPRKPLRCDDQDIYFMDEDTPLSQSLRNRARITQIRTTQQSGMLRYVLHTCLVLSFVNPVLGVIVVMLVYKSKKNQALHRYDDASRTSMQAIRVAVVGILLTVLLLVTFSVYSAMLKQTSNVTNNISNNRGARYDISNNTNVVINNGLLSQPPSTTKVEIKPSLSTASISRTKMPMAGVNSFQELEPARIDSRKENGTHIIFTFASGKTLIYENPK